MTVQQDSIAHSDVGMLFDTLGTSVLDARLPQYYREGFFSGDTLFHPELPGGRYGVAGNPIPYTVHGDSIITSLLLACFMLTVFSIAIARRFILRQTRNFFLVRREGTTEVTETATEFRYQVFLAFLACILLALLCYFYTIYFVGDTFILRSDYYLIVIYLAMAVAYFFLKVMAYSLVNVVFFDGKRNVQWLKTYLFITSVEGVLAFPAVIVRAYLNCPIKIIIVYLTFVLVFVKFLTFYKSFLIFFRTNVVKLQIILYFCTLEIIPVLSFWGVLGIVANSLKINF